LSDRRQFDSALKSEVAPEQVGYYPYFDYLRAIAAIGVFIGHADLYRFFPANLGNACVQVFFALSGFLIGGILLRSSTEDLPRFYFNRSSRIWIPYAIAIALLAIVTEIKQGLFSDPKFSEFFFYKATFVYNWFGPPQLATMIHHMPLDGTGNHFWSICVEEQFYLIAPFIIIFMKRWVATALLISLAALNFYIPHSFAPVALGVLLALTNKDWLLASFVVALISVCASAFLSYEVWMPFLAVAVVAIAARKGSQTTIGRVIGGASYPFYLNHWIGLFGISALTKIGIPFGASALLGLMMAIAIGIFHYEIIDRWIATNRSRWFSKHIGVAMCATGIGLVIVGMSTGLLLFKAR
jgi:peptidoglycan/LPS O-acetylase OafA/YrhL